MPTRQEKHERDAFNVYGLLHRCINTSLRSNNVRACRSQRNTRTQHTHAPTSSSSSTCLMQRWASAVHVVRISEALPLCSNVRTGPPNKTQPYRDTLLCIPIPRRNDSWITTLETRSATRTTTRCNATDSTGHDTRRAAPPPQYAPVQCVNDDTTAFQRTPAITMTQNAHHANKKRALHKATASRVARRSPPRAKALAREPGASQQGREG